jgi:hypothetical protein
LAFLAIERRDELVQAVAKRILAFEPDVMTGLLREQKGRLFRQWPFSLSAFNSRLP